MGLIFLHRRVYYLFLCLCQGYIFYFYFKLFDWSRNNKKKSTATAENAHTHKLLLSSQYKYDSLDATRYSRQQRMSWKSYSGHIQQHQELIPTIIIYSQNYFDISAAFDPFIQRNNSLLMQFVRYPFLLAADDSSYCRLQSIKWNCKD